MEKIGQFRKMKGERVEPQPYARLDYNIDNPKKSKIIGMDKTLRRS